MAKNIGKALIIIGILALVAAISLALTIGGKIVPILTIGSVIINSVGITLVRGK